MSRPAALRRFAVACAALILALLPAGGCGSSPAAEPSPAKESRTWLIADDRPADDSAGLGGRAAEAVLRTVSDLPQIDIRTVSEDTERLIARLLAAEQLPDLLTVPARSLLREKILGSGSVWAIDELSAELFDSIPEKIRAAYADADGHLRSLPGGYQADGGALIASEGVYIREEYASLLGDPAMDTPERFCRALEQLTELMQDGRLSGSGELVPIVFGIENSGFATVEHFCGLMPVYRDGGATFHRIYSPQLTQVLSFFDRLEPFCAYPIFEEHSAERLEELLQHNVFVYIGPSAPIEAFGRRVPRARFKRIDPPFADGGYLKAYSRLGMYETFVSRRTPRDEAARLLLTLSSAEASRTFMYGIEDEDWVEANGTVVPLRGTLERLQADPAAALRQSGIAAFPFLSRDGVCVPYLTAVTDRVRDITAEERVILPVDHTGWHVRQMDRRLAAYYAEVASASVSVQDILARVRALDDLREPLIGG